MRPAKLRIFTSKSEPQRHAVNGTAQPRLIILGAGRPFRGEQHPGLRGIGFTGRVLDWLLHAVSGIAPRVYFVGGYQLEEIASQYPNLRYVVNPKWEQTRAAVSLLEAPLVGTADHYVTYVDILFHETIVQEMARTSGDIVVAVDSRWRERFKGRTAEDLARCEKLNLVDGTVTRLGPDIEPELADAEFVGLVRFSPTVSAYLAREATALAPHLRHANLSQLVELLRTRGFSVNALDVEGNWAELNEGRDLAHFVLGTKAQTLQRLQRLVQHSRIEDQVCFTVACWQSDPAAVLAQIDEAFGNLRLVVRSSALSEDGFASANAGAYNSVLDVDSTEPDALGRAIAEVVGSYDDGNPANQILVQPMVSDVAASGVAFTRTLDCGAPYYVISYDDQSRCTDTITNGSSTDHKTLVVYRDARDADRRLPSAVRGLLPAMREIEQLLNYDALDIEFVINTTGQVHVLQVRPIAVDHAEWDVTDAEVGAMIKTAQARFADLQRPGPFVLGSRAFFGVMPDWNPAEIIGTKPGRLAVGLYRYLIMDRIWATQRAEYGYRDVRPAPLLVSFAGQPYVDIRASFNSFVPAALDDQLAGRLVDFYLGWLEQHPQLHDKVEFDVVPTCYGLNFASWQERLTRHGGFAPAEVAALRDALKAITRDAFVRNGSDLAAIDLLEARYDRIMAADLPPLERATLLLEDCRRHGTLGFAHLARSAFVAVTLLRTAVETGAIDRAAMDDFLRSLRTVTRRFTEEALATAAGRLGWDDYVRRYGHLRPGTYDITSPHYAADPERYLRPLVTAAREAGHDPDEGRAWQAARPAFARALAAAGLANDLEVVERFMREAIEGREYAKFVFTRNLSAALESLAAFGRGFGLSRSELANIPLEDFFALRTGTICAPDPATWLAERAREGLHVRSMGRVMELPPLLLDAGDMEVFLYLANQPNYVGSERVVADCVDLARVAVGEPITLAGRIALIPQADPGYDWLFGQGILGLITMYGGANSHMAIRAAEFGLPAAIGIGESRYAKLVGAQVLELDAGNRRIQVIR
jgi:glutamine kinase